MGLHHHPPVRAATAGSAARRAALAMVRDEARRGVPAHRPRRGAGRPLPGQDERRRAAPCRRRVPATTLTTPIAAPSRQLGGELAAEQADSRSAGPSRRAAGGRRPPRAGTASSSAGSASPLARTRPAAGAERGRGPARRRRSRRRRCSAARRDAGRRDRDQNRRHDASAPAVTGGRRGCGFAACGHLRGSGHGHLSWRVTPANFYDPPELRVNRRSEYRRMN